jgi:hypothetical protein
MQAAAESIQTPPIHGIPVINVQTAALIRQSAIANSKTRRLTTGSPMISVEVAKTRRFTPNGVFSLSYRKYLLRIVGCTVNLRLLALLASNSGERLAKIGVTAFSVSKRMIKDGFHGRFLSCMQESPRWFSRTSALPRRI